MAWETGLASNGGNGEGVPEGVSVLEGERPTVKQRLAIVDDAVVEAEALEDVGVDEAGWAEPAAAEVDGGDVAAGDARVHDLHRVRRDPVRQRLRRTLADHYVRLGTFVAPYPVWLHPIFILINNLSLSMLPTCPKKHRQESNVKAIKTPFWS